MRAEFTLLIVDDDEIQRQTLKAKFQHYTNSVFEAGNCREALEVMKKHKVDVVISDFLMPGGDETGVDLLKQVREKHAGDSITILTTGFSDYLPESTFKSNFSAVFTKPFDLNTLVKTVLDKLSVKYQKEAA